MRTRDITISLTALAVAAAMLFAAGSQLDYINSQRKAMNLVVNEPLENAPPALAFTTVALGAFRGLIVDVLWIRAERLKEAGQFFDARQLAEWIVTLQPRFSNVWTFQAWNMAYNISVTIPASEPDQRWQWVKNGYELLRDKGIPLNPHDIDLYYQLALIFQHKMGAVADDAHMYYKLRLAEDMKPLLGPADEQYFDKLAAAPKSLEQIMTDPDIAKFVNALRAADETFADDKTLVANYLALRQQPLKFKPQVFRVIDDFRGSEALGKFDVFAKAYQLRNVWKLEPELMIQINNTYGPVEISDPNRHLPMDWRLPDTHAIYWAVKGLEMAPKGDESIDVVNTDRIISHSLANLYNYGTLFIYEVPESEMQKMEQDVRPDRIPGMDKAVYLRPDMRMFDSYDKTQQKIMEKYKSDPGIYETIQTGHRNFLKNAVIDFYLAGHEQYARGIYKKLGELYPRKEFSVDFPVYLRSSLREQLQQLGLTEARRIIQGLLQNAYFYYAMRDDDEAYRREQMAAEVHKQYLELFRDEQHRVGLQSLSRMKYFAVMDFINDQRFPESLRNSLKARIRLERPELSEMLEKEESKFMQEQTPAEPNQPTTNRP